MTILGYDFEGYFTWFNIKLRCKIWLTQHHVPCDFNEQERDAIYQACAGEPDLRGIMGEILKQRR